MENPQPAPVLDYATPSTLGADNVPLFDPAAEAAIDAGRSPIALRRIFRDHGIAARYFARSMAGRFPPEGPLATCCRCDQPASHRQAWDWTDVCRISQWRFTWGLTAARTVVAIGFTTHHDFCDSCGHHMDTCRDRHQRHVVIYQAMAIPLWVAIVLLAIVLSNSRNDVTWPLWGILSLAGIAVVTLMGPSLADRRLRKEMPDVMRWIRRKDVFLKSAGAAQRVSTDVTFAAAAQTPTTSSSVPSPSQSPSIQPAPAVDSHRADGQ